MSALARVCAILAAVGALNWVALWFFNDDLATILLGAQRTVGADFLYILVGLASLYALIAALGLVGIGARSK
jgi:uncharacterized membrane protein YuzA (DUF378 family)